MIVDEVYFRTHKARCDGAMVDEETMIRLIKRVNLKKRSLYRVLDENEKRVNKIEFCVNNGRLSDRRCVSMGTT